MEQTGEYRILAPRTRVWEAINDPDVLKRCIEGCEELTKTGENAFHAVVRARLGPMNAAFVGDVVLKDLDPPTSYTLEVSVKAGAAGFANGAAKVSLADEGAGTLLAYAAEGRVGGKLAQIGQRLIDAAARKTADDFFTALDRELGLHPGPAPTKRVRSSPFLIWGSVAAVAIALGLLAWRLIGG